MYRVIKRTITIAALTAALSAISAPVAAARFDLNPPASSHPVTSVAPTQSSSQSSSQTSASTSTGFDWGDAALGAAGMLALLSVGTGAVLVGRRGRRLRAATR
jgi:uncharacterized iron-regulated membrane protein